LRVVAGRLRGRRLAAPPGETLRPTSDRAREALFNILASGGYESDLVGCHFLDAFCGTGAAAIEALSRGAAHATLIDRDLTPARENVRALDLTGETSLVAGDLARLGPRPAGGGGPADIAFLDPPYDTELAVQALHRLGFGGWLKPGALVIVESAARRPAPDFAETGYTLVDERRYGAARLSFLRVNGDGTL
jgi:16S rRNA (guanine966-N2)-methyltransferase